MKWTKYGWFAMIAVLICSPAVFAVHDEDKGPEKFGRYEFKEQDIKEATDECEAGGASGPEFVPTVRDNEPNLALLKDAKPEASSQLEGWCPRRHCIEYLNDGFYNNCRSWIIGPIPGWAQIDMGDVANVNRIYFASDHAQDFHDRRKRLTLIFSSRLPKRIQIPKRTHGQRFTRTKEILLARQPSLPSKI